MTDAELREEDMYVLPVSFCKHCECMTKTINGYCCKCFKVKEQTKKGEI